MEGGIILGNKIFDVVFVAWFLAQFYKVAESLVKERRLNFKRMWETGGMPSSHSATVASLATAVGIGQGVTSPLFAVTVILAVIVMHDAAGVRRAAGKQAGVLNKLSRSLSGLFENRFQAENLRELLGHSPVEVLVGAGLGVAVAFAMKFYLLAP